MKWIFIFIAFIFISAESQAQRKKTVGEVLHDIDSKSRGEQVSIRKQTITLPKAQQNKITQVPLYAVKPPRTSSLFQESDSDEVKLEHMTDQGIQELYRLTQKYSKSKNRGELWLRLAELYVEKAKYIEYRLQKDYDDKLKNYLDKKGPKPRLNLSASKEYNKKAITLYEWFLRDFPRDSKVDQALFFLGYNYVELEQVKKGISYYERLTREHGKSPYVGEAYFALGEYYFENDKWGEALKAYSDVLKNPRARLYTFALYKIGWCQYRLDRAGQALKTLEQVIKFSRTLTDQEGIDGKKSVNKIRLGSEALKDVVLFYSDVGNYETAKSYFYQLGGAKAQWIMLEKLAYLYSDTGKKEQAQYVFKQLLDYNPTAPKAFDYQYQIVQNFSTSKNQRTYRDELYNWVDNYNPESSWGRANSGNQKLMEEAFTLRESALRNYTLLLHKNAQNGQKKQDYLAAREAYQRYLSKFSSSQKAVEMQFFYAELLYAMGDFNNAGAQYKQVAERDQKGKYFEPSVLNSVLALEKNLKSDEQIKKITGDSLQPAEFGEPEKTFIAAAEYYLKTFPRGEKTADVKFKIGRLHYSYNHFDEALKSFKLIITQHPRTPLAVYSANLILDIYNLKKDYDGLAREGQTLMHNKDLASQGFQTDVRDVVEKVNFKKAQDLELAKDYEGAAKAFADFAKNNSNSNLTVSAAYNAGINYERAFKIPEAIVFYSRVTKSPKKGQEKVYYKSLLLLGRLYEQTFQYDKAAMVYQKYADENQKDKLTPDLYYNIALIWEGQKDYNKAISNYEKYYKMSRRLDRADALFKIASIYEKTGKALPAQEYYNRYLHEGGNDSEKIIEANFKIGELSEKRGKTIEADKAFYRTIAAEKNISKKGAGRVWAAEARFKLTEKIYNDFISIRIPANQSKQAKAVQEKLALLTKLSTNLADVIKYDEGNMVIASLAKQGQAYEHMSKAISSAPIPKGLSKDEFDTYKKGVDQVALPMKAKAVENYTSAINKSFEINYYNKWTRLALNKMSEYEPEKYSDPKEIVSPISKTEDMGI